MITPAFDLSQDPEYLILNICVPYTRTSEFDLYIDGTDFKFYAKPYFLRWVNTYKLVYLLFVCAISNYNLCMVYFYSFQVISSWKNSGGWERKGQIWHW